MADKVQKSMAQPINWLKMIKHIRKVRAKYPAPVDSMGCDQSHYQTAKPIDQRFLVLVSLMLSSQTKDPITWAAVQKLKENGLGKPDKLVAAKEKDIEDLIHPVGFYRRKAIYLKQVSQILLNQYNGDIPNSVEDLCKLPGVGPKMAHLCMQEAWNIVSGIGVDTHVHRISARLGWVPSNGIKSPEDTRKALEQWLPREYWREINHMLVGFGQTICTPVHPKCNECYNNELCPSSSLKAKATTKTTKKAKTKTVATVATAATATSSSATISTTTSNNSNSSKGSGKRATSTIGTSKKVATSTSTSVNTKQEQQEQKDEHAAHVADTEKQQQRMPLTRRSTRATNKVAVVSSSSKQREPKRPKLSVE